jgi:hypothetical protein
MLSGAGTFNSYIILLFIQYMYVMKGFNLTLFTFVALVDLLYFESLTQMDVFLSDCQCTSCNGPGFDPSIRRHSGI